jgi:hypothetical protein
LTAYKENAMTISNLSEGTFVTIEGALYQDQFLNKSGHKFGSQGLS